MDYVYVSSDKSTGYDVADDKADKTGIDDNVAFSVAAEKDYLSAIQRTEICETQQSRESSLGEEKATSYHFANVAFYVKDDNTKKVYAVTNRHVTLQAEKFFIQMINEKESILLGSSIKSVKTNDGNVDVDLIEIDPSIENQVRNKERQDQHVSIYKGSFNSIYGLEVFKYRPGKGPFEILSCDTPNTGIIISRAEHKELKELFKKENGQFFVTSEYGHFSVEGESGTALGVKTELPNVITLIGIICGGFEHYTVCQFLPIFFSHFEDRYGMNLQMYNCGLASVIASGNSSAIPFGIKISFTCIYKSPEHIAHLNFDLVDRALDLMCMKYIPSDIDVQNHEPLLEVERSLSLLVSKRENLQNCSVFENDKPDYVAVERGIKACDYLYNGNAQKAEHCLKEAVLSVRKMDSFGMRILCKLTTYITWCCLVTNTSAFLKQLKNILDVGIDIFENDFYTLVGFPKEALGYMFFDFSRYYMCKYDNMRACAYRKVTAERKIRKKAIVKASVAVGIFQQDHESNKTKETYRRLVLAKCQHAYVLLGCGHEFNVIPDEVSTEDITEAEYIIKSMQCDGFKVPLVQQVDVLIASINLDYRKRCIKDALDKINTCLNIPEVNKYFIGYHRANCRLVKLRDILENKKACLRVSEA